MKNMMLIKKIFQLGLLSLGLGLSSMLMAGENPTVAITQIVDHPVLTQAYHGTVAGLKENGYTEGKNLHIIYENAQGDTQRAERIARDFVSLKPDVMVAISTPSAQVLMHADRTAEIPLVFSAVTDPLSAKLVPTLKQPGGFVTGVYDMPPVAAKVQIMRELLPQLKTLGVLYNPDEINSVHMIDELKTAGYFLKIIEAPVKSDTDITVSTKTLLGKVDAIYVPADNTVVAQIDKVLALTMENKIPLFASEHGSVEKGALVALAYDQYEVGRATGAIVAQILGGKRPGDIDVVKLSHPDLYINTATAQKLNIQIPDKMIKSAAKLVN